MLASPFAEQVQKKSPNRATDRVEAFAAQRAALVARGATPQQLARFDRLVSPPPEPATDPVELKRFEDALQLLNPVVRDALTAYYVCGHSAASIARSMGMSEQACLDAMRSAKNKLKQCLPRRRQRNTTTSAA